MCDLGPLLSGPGTIKPVLNCSKQAYAVTSGSSSPSHECTIVTPQGLLFLLRSSGGDSILLFRGRVPPTLMGVASVTRLTKAPTLLPRSVCSAATIASLP